MSPVLLDLLELITELLSEDSAHHLGLSLAL
jgi:hypothetical protein